MEGTLVEHGRLKSTTKMTLCMLIPLMKKHEEPRNFKLGRWPIGRTEIRRGNGSNMVIMSS